MENELSSGRIAVIGERELILGFRLIGMESSIEVTEKNAGTEFMKLYHSGKYSLIMASENIKKNIDRRILMTTARVQVQQIGGVQCFRPFHPV